MSNQCKFSSCERTTILTDGYCEIHAALKDRQVNIRKNKNKPRLTKAMLMPLAMECLVDVIEFGEKKYGPAYDKGWMLYNDTEVMDSLLRHAMAIVNGEMIDQESGLPHAAHMLFNAAAYAEIALTEKN